MSGKYYPNNWDVIKDAPDEVFEPCTWEDFATWKIGGWEIPSSVVCIIRAENIRTGKITEHTYQQPKAAHKRLIKYMESGDYEVVVCNSEAVHLIKLADDEDFDTNSD